MNKDIKIELKKIVDNTKVELKQVADSAKQQIVLKLVIPYLTDYLKDLVAEKQAKNSGEQTPIKRTYNSVGAVEVASNLGEIFKKYDNDHVYQGRARYSSFIHPSRKNPIKELNSDSKEIDPIIKKTSNQYLGHYVPKWVKSSFADIANHTVFNKNKSDPVKETLNSTETHPSFLSFIKKAHPELINDPAFAGDDDSIFEKDNEVPKSKEELREIVRNAKDHTIRTWQGARAEIALNHLVDENGLDNLTDSNNINHDYFNKLIKDIGKATQSQTLDEQLNKIDQITSGKFADIIEKALTFSATNKKYNNLDENGRPDFRSHIEPRKTKEELKELYKFAKANLINCTAVADPSFSKELFKIFKGDSSNAPEPPKETLSKGYIVRPYIYPDKRSTKEELSGSLNKLLNELDEFTSDAYSNLTDKVRKSIVDNKLTNETNLSKIRPKAIKEEQSKPKCKKEKIENKPPTTKSRRISKK